MTTSAQDVWMPILLRLSAVLVQSEDFRDDLTPEARSSGWCGLPPASEEEVLEVEMRLGLTLPPSYRSFLSVSNGWRPFDNLIERLMTVLEIGYYREIDPEDVAMTQKYFQENDISDIDYLDYDNPAHCEALRHRYYPTSVLIGKGWGVESERILLNPSIVSIGGEWEVIYFANWIPGNRRYRSFRHFMEGEIKQLENFKASGPK